MTARSGGRNSADPSLWTPSSPSWKTSRKMIWLDLRRHDGTGIHAVGRRSWLTGSRPRRPTGQAGQRVRRAARLHGGSDRRERDAYGVRLSGGFPSRALHSSSTFSDASTATTWRRVQKTAHSTFTSGGLKRRRCYRAAPGTDYCESYRVALYDILATTIYKPAKSSFFSCPRNAGSSASRVTGARRAAKVERHGSDANDPGSAREASGLENPLGPTNGRSARSPASSAGAAQANAHAPARRAPPGSGFLDSSPSIVTVPWYCVDCEGTGSERTALVLLSRTRFAAALCRATDRLSGRFHLSKLLNADPPSRPSHCIWRRAADRTIPATATSATTHGPARDREPGRD